MDQQPLNDGRRPKKWLIEAKLTWHHFVGKNELVWTKKKELKRRAHDLKNQDASEGAREGPTQGFNFVSK